MKTMGEVEPEVAEKASNKMLPFDIFNLSLHKILTDNFKMRTQDLFRQMQIKHLSVSHGSE